MVQRHVRNPWILVLLLFIGAIIGSLAGNIMSKIDVLVWTNAGPFFPISFAFDADFMRLAVEGALRISVMTVVGVISAIITFMKI